MRSDRSSTARREATLLYAISQPRPAGDTPHSPLEFTVVMDKTMTSPTSSSASAETLLSHDEQARTRPTTPQQGPWDTRRPLEHRTDDRGAGATAIRCLIVDDNDHFRQVVGDLLGAEGIAIIGVASTSSEAIRLHDELRPDVTLIDIVLGEETGFDLAEQLTAVTNTEPTTAILMSVSLGEEDVMDMVAGAGAAAFLPKLDISGSAVREICRWHRSEPHAWPRTAAQTRAGRRSVTGVATDPHEVPADHDLGSSLDRSLTARASTMAWFYPPPEP
jgi:DNA-binding NarL/FixJ family response regulator